VKRLAFGVLAALPAPALAQSYQCAPLALTAPVRPVAPDGPARRVPITGYTLAASWSPEYCKTARDTRSMQCSAANGRFGFVLHGLWPEGRGSAPQWCRTAPLPSASILRPYLCMTPSAQLLAHEWAKHGSCMARTPGQYFRAAAILWRSLHWPDVDRLSRKDGLTVRDLREAFVAENPAWRPDQVGVVLSRTGWLREMRLCYSRRFLPVRCDRRRLGTPDAAPLKIWRGL